jgi:hypothetical protein
MTDTRLVNIGEHTYTVTMCQSAGCVSAAGVSGWCHAHRATETEVTA